jgi:hypothetical protein
MITYSELIKRAENLEYLLEIADKKNPDIKDASEILRPLIKKVLNKDTDLPMSLPMQSFFYRQENSLSMHIDFMNAVAVFDVGLEQLDRKIKPA